MSRYEICVKGREVMGPIWYDFWPVGERVSAQLLPGLLQRMADWKPKWSESFLPLSPSERETLLELSIAAADLTSPPE